MDWTKIDWGSLIGAVGGFAGIATLLIGLLKLKPDNTKTLADADAAKAAATEKLVTSVGNVADSYDQVLATMKAEHAERIRLLEASIIECKAQLQEELVEVNCRVDKLTGANKNLTRGIYILVAQMKEANITPKWTPRDKDVVFDTGD